jgi:hypothetical protein
MSTRPHNALLVVAALCLAPAAGAATWFVGMDAGSGSADETGAFGVAVPGFGGPTVDHDTCGGTAVITVGVEPTVNAISGNSTNYRVFGGVRGEAWGFEFARFNVARLEGGADSGPYAVAQPTCNPVPTGPFQVDAFGRKVESIAFDGWSFTPVYSWGFAEGWALDLRATIAFWDREQRSEWQVMAFETDNGVPNQPHVAAYSHAERGGSGVDLGLGIGLAWSIDEGARVRLRYDHQPYSDFSVAAYTLGFSIDFDD